MAKFYGHSAAAASLSYIRDNADVLYVMGSANGGAFDFSWTNATASNIVSAFVSAGIFTIASTSVGPAMAIAAMNSQGINGSGTATHLLLGNVSAQRILYVTTVSS